MRRIAAILLFPAYAFAAILIYLVAEHDHAQCDQ